MSNEVNFKEIINPSDKAFINVQDKEAACLAIALMSEGRYGIEETLSIFLFGGSDDWFIKEFGRNVEESFEHVGKHRISKALRTVRLDGERTSLNDIVERAINLADLIEKGDEG